MKMIKEIYKIVPNFPDYEVSNLGNVRSNKNNKSKLLKQTYDNNYNLVRLSNKGKITTFRVHQLVAIVFLNHKPKKGVLVVDHINNNSLDNRLENLQVITQRQNLTKDRINKSSNFTGVSKKGNKFLTKIRLKYNKENLNIHLGSFTNEDVAGLIYKIALNNLSEFNGDKNKFRTTIKGIFRNNYFDTLI
jgi:hypothetical protein